MRDEADGPVPDGLLERDTELTRIDGLLAAGRASDGGLLLIGGPAGIGKSALLRAACDRARHAGLRVLAARCSELEARFSFGVARQLFEPLLAAADLAERESLLAGAARFGMTALDATGDAAPPIGTDPAFTAIHGLYWLAVNASQRIPALLAVDDLHDADPASLDFVLYLAARLEGLPVALAVSWRTGEEGAAADRVARLVQLAPASVTYPAPLTLSATTEVLAQAFGQAPRQRLAVSCHAATGGNPFLLQELAATLRADGADATDLAEDRVPQMSPVSIARSVALRLGRLDATAGQVARATAILGDGVRLRHAAALAGIPLADAAVAADQLAAIEILAAGTPLRFVHAIVRAAVLDAIPAAERGVRHAEAARILAAAGVDLEEICAHLLASEPAGSTETAELLRVAGRRALAHGAPQSAVGYLRRAVAEEAEGDQRAALLHDLGLAEALTRDPAAARNLRAALDLAVDQTERAQIAVDLAQMLVLAGEWDAGVAVVKAEIARQEYSGDTVADAAGPSAAVIRLWTCWAYFAGADSRTAGELDRRLPQLLALTRGSAPRQRLLAGFLALGNSPHGEDPEQSRKSLDRAFAKDYILGHVDTEPLFAALAMFATVTSDDPGWQDALVEQLLAQSRSRGSVTGVMIGLGLRVAVRNHGGDLRGAEADLRMSMEIALQQGMMFAIPVALHWGADVLVERPEAADLAMLLSAMDLDSSLGQTILGAMLRLVRGQIAMASADLTTARTDLWAAARTFQKLPVTPSRWRWRSAVALLLAADDQAEAVRLAKAEFEESEQLGHALSAAIALRALGVVEGGEAGLGHLRQAASLLAGTVWRLEYARTLVDLGAALRRSNQRAAARQPLLEGLDLADRCGATRLTERARAELLAAGLRPRRTALSGLDALTVSELRVAELAATGLSNPEIAQALFVTLNTVEGHLRHVYRKLSVTSRRQLPDALKAALPSSPDRPRG